MERRRLLAAVVLSACIAFVGGGVSAWFIYAHFGPVQQIINQPKAGGAGTNTLQSVAAVAKPSVVAIATQPVGTGDLLNGTAAIVNGFIASPDGIVITTTHAISGATQLKVGLDDGRVFDAEVAPGGVDVTHGLVALRIIGAGSLPALHFAKSAPIPGDVAIAVSRSPLQGLNLGSGNVSSVGRSVEIDQSTRQSVIDAISVDAAPEPQADGAPLLDGSGAVIGVDVAITAATPPPGLTALSGQAAAALLDHVAKGSVAAKASFGADASPLDVASATAAGLHSGAIVRFVLPGGAAEQAGIQPGNIVVSVNGIAMDATHHFDAASLGFNVGQQVVVVVITNSGQQTVSLTVGSE